MRKHSVNDIERHAIQLLLNQSETAAEFIALEPVLNTSKYMRVVIQDTTYEGKNAEFIADVIWSLVTGTSVNLMGIYDLDRDDCRAISNMLSAWIKQEVT